MELQEKIIEEARRLHGAEQRKLMIDAMCCIELVGKRASNSSKKRLACAYISQAPDDKCVLLLEKALDVVIECNDQALEALAADWAQVSILEGAAPVMSLHKASGWEKDMKCFKKKSVLLEATLAKDDASGNMDRAACLATLHRCMKFVQALRLDVRSPFA